MKAAVFSAIMAMGSNPNAESQSLLEVHAAAQGAAAGQVTRQLVTFEQYREQLTPIVARAGAPR